MENSFVFCFLCWGRIKQYESSLCFVLCIFSSILCKPLCFFSSGAFQGLKQEVLENNLSFWLLWKNIPGVTNSNPNRIKQTPKWTKQTRLIFPPHMLNLAVFYHIYLWMNSFYFQSIFSSISLKMFTILVHFSSFLLIVSKKNWTNIVKLAKKKVEFKIITLVFKTFAVGESLWTKLC